MYGFSVTDAMIKPKSRKENTENEDEKPGHRGQFTDLSVTYRDTCHRCRKGHGAEHREKKPGRQHYGGYCDRHGRKSKAMRVSLSAKERETR